jgi:regulator of sigma D
MLGPGDNEPGLHDIQNYQQETRGPNSTLDYHAHGRRVLLYTFPNSMITGIRHDMHLYLHANTATLVRKVQALLAFALS